jgi:hypothetical protein
VRSLVWGCRDRDLPGLTLSIDCKPFHYHVFAAKTYRDGFRYDTWGNSIRGRNGYHSLSASQRFPLRCRLNFRSLFNEPSELEWQ